ncbi:MAG: FAD-binding oxidoreductase [Pacificimonas sp.]
MAMLDPDLIDQFVALAGPNGAVTDEHDLAPWLTDWRRRKTGRAAVMLQPESTDTLAAIVGLASRTGTALVPQGGNTGLVGGSVPEAAGDAILVSLRRMNRIRDLDAAGDTVTAEAGVVLQHLHEAAAAQGRMFPLSLGAKGSATIGGLISTNAGGVQVLRYGTMRTQILGLEAVLPDGTVLDQLTPLRKDNTGLDIKQLLIGAEGTLGFVTAASLRLLSAPREVATAFVGIAEPGQGLSLLSRLKQATGDLVDSFELLPRAAVDLVTAHVPGTRDPLADAHKWYVLVEATSSAAGETLRAALENELAAAMDDGLIADAVIAENGTQRDELWRLRESIAEAEKVDGLALKHDIAVPVSDVPRFIAEVTPAIEARWPGMSVFAFGHLGDGNLHYNVRSDARMPREMLMTHGPDVAVLVYDAVAGFGGSISAEHGIGTLKAAELASRGDAGKLAAMRAVKAALDPKGIMNPGKLFA